MNIIVTLSRADAKELLDVLLHRPHNEEWSNRVVDRLEQALTPHLTLVGKDDSA